MTVHAYLFELRSIQPFLFATGKLRDMVSGSELIDYLCLEPLQVALDACGLNDENSKSRSPRCAGGAFYLLLDDEDKAKRFRQLWPVMVAQLLPGIEQVDAFCSANTAQEAIQKGLNELRASRNIHQAELPPASPLALRSQRTGQVATTRDRDEALDASTRIKRIFNRPTGTDPLTDRFCAAPGYYWPDNFEADSSVRKRFPLGESKLVGLVHADGNGLGEILRVISEATQTASDQVYVKVYRAFSDGLDQATCKATQLACQEVLLPACNEHKVVPARPLVLGGDDLTLLVRADLAIPFTAAFTREFEISSAHFLSDLIHQMRTCGLPEADIAKIPHKLTACAGITYMKSSQPFAQCYELTESLCSRAKMTSRQVRSIQDQPIESSLAFHKLQGSLITDADSLFKQELTVQTHKQNAKAMTLGIPVYGFQETGALPALKHLHALADCFGNNRLNDKRLRALATLLHSNTDLAIKDYHRWRTLAEKADTPTSSALQRFDQALNALMGSSSSDLPANKDHTLSPLADLLIMLSVQRNTEEAKND